MKPSARLIAFTQPFEAEDLGIKRPVDLIEFAGRWDYGTTSIAKMGQPSKDGTPIIRKWMDAGEESMVEMVDAIFFITCSRVVSHELVRHRIASFQQESQRFVSYEDEDPDESFYTPPEISESDSIALKDYSILLRDDLVVYKALKGAGVPKQLARYVLPNAMRTRMVMKTNLREWRHILKLRLHKSAQPEMRELMQQIYDQLNEKFPEIFGDLTFEERAAR